MIEEGFVSFFETSVVTNPLKPERYLLPTIIGELIKNGECTVKVLPANDTWYGMTYKEDVEAVAESFGKMIKEVKYRSSVQ